LVWVTARSGFTDGGQKKGPLRFAPEGAFEKFVQDPSSAFWDATTIMAAEAERAGLDTMEMPAKRFIVAR
jgi:hypothetical protein